jgi:hypothetical protein
MYDGFDVENVVCFRKKDVAFPFDPVGVVPQKGTFLL